MKRALLLYAFLFLSFSCLAQGNNRGIVQGKDWAYLFTTPTGWIWDSQSLVKQNIHGLFYKKGEKYNPQKLHIYINPVALPENTTLQELISRDIAGFKSEYNDIHYDVDHKKTLKSGKAVDIYFLNDGKSKYFQSICFVPFKKLVFIFVLSARSIEERRENITYYYELLDSFFTMEKQS